MERIDYVIKALEFIDNNYKENLNYEIVANKYNISQLYFHRVFSSIVGKTITEYIREKRLNEVAKKLYNTNELIIDICFDCGFTSLQSFCRIFKNYYGITPREYRKKGLEPVAISLETMISNFRKNTLGGINMKPRIIEHDELTIVGFSGHGNRTKEIWEKFNDKYIKGKEFNNCYEVRFYGKGLNKCHVGCNVKNNYSNLNYERVKLPASKYASFDIYVEKGYDSSNKIIDKWLMDNKDKYEQRYYNKNVSYVIEYYDEKFQGEESESIVEIWIPIIDIT